MSVSINGTHLCRIGNQFQDKSTKFLGIFIDETLSWKYHIDHINKRVSRALYAIKQVTHFLPPERLRTLYFATIHPHLSYGILAWGSVSKSTVNKLTLMQKRAIRYITRSNFNSHTEPLLKQLNILNIKDLYEYEVTLFMYKYINNIKLPQSFRRVYQMNREVRKQRETRQSSLLHIERCDSAFAKRLPLYQFPVVWNRWSSSISEDTSLNGMKKIVKHSLISNYANIVKKCKNPRCTDCNNE